MQWVDCSERMPEKYVPAIILDKNGEIHRARYIGEDVYGAFWEECTGFRIRYRPVKWAPLEEIETPANDVRTVKQINDAVDEALRILDAMHGRMDYGDYCDLHDAISMIGMEESE